MKSVYFPSPQRYDAGVQRAAGQYAKKFSSTIVAAETSEQEAKVLPEADRRARSVSVARTSSLSDLTHYLDNG